MSTEEKKNIQHPTVFFPTPSDLSPDTSSPSQILDVKKSKPPEKFFDDNEMLEEFKHQNQAEKDKQIKPSSLAGGAVVLTVIGILAWRAHVLATDPARAQEVNIGWQQFIENHQFWFGVGVMALFFLGVIAYYRWKETPSLQFKESALDLARRVEKHAREEDLNWLMQKLIAPAHKADAAELLFKIFPQQLKPETNAVIHTKLRKENNKIYAKILRRAFVDFRLPFNATLTQAMRDSPEIAAKALVKMLENGQGKKAAQIYAGIKKDSAIISTLTTDYGTQKDALILISQPGNEDVSIEALGYLVQTGHLQEAANVNSFLSNNFKKLPSGKTVALELYQSMQHSPVVASSPPHKKRGEILEKDTHHVVPAWMPGSMAQESETLTSLSTGSLHPAGMTGHGVLRSEAKQSRKFGLSGLLRFARNDGREEPHLAEALVYLIRFAPKQTAKLVHDVLKNDPDKATLFNIAELLDNLAAKGQPATAAQLIIQVSHIDKESAGNIFYCLDFLAALRIPEHAKKFDIQDAMKKIDPEQEMVVVNECNKILKEDTGPLASAVIMTAWAKHNPELCVQILAKMAEDKFLLLEWLGVVAEKLHGDESISVTKILKEKYPYAYASARMYCLGQHLEHNNTSGKHDLELKLELGAEGLAALVRYGDFEKVVHILAVEWNENPEDTLRGRFEKNHRAEYCSYDLYAQARLGRSASSHLGDALTNFMKMNGEQARGFPQDQLLSIISCLSEYRYFKEAADLICCFASYQQQGDTINPRCVSLIRQLKKEGGYEDLLEAMEEKYPRLSKKIDEQCKAKNPFSRSDFLREKVAARPDEGAGSGFFNR